MFKLNSGVSQIKIPNSIKLNPNANPEHNPNSAETHERKRGTFVAEQKLDTSGTTDGSTLPLDHFSILIHWGGALSESMEKIPTCP